MTKVILVAVLIAVSSRGFGQMALDSSWTATVNGRTVQVSPDGSFLITNISAPDNFGPDGPGSARDNLSDDFFRLIAVSHAGGVTRYAFSEPFQITAGGTFSIGAEALTFTTTPPPQPTQLMASIVAPSQSILTVGSTTQLTVTATLVDGTTQDVTPRTSWTTYRSSNTAVAKVNGEGSVTAMGPGLAYITASNEGTTSTIAVRVISSAATAMTIVEGFVRDANAAPVVGATVTISPSSLPAVTDGAGRFSVAGVASNLGLVSVFAQANVNGTLMAGASGQVTPVPGGMTDAGIIILAPNKIWVGGTGNWHVASNWLPSGEPTATDDVIIDPSGAVVTVTVQQSGAVARSILCSENLTIPSGGSLTVGTATQINGGTLTVSGGTYVGGSLQANGAFNLSAGTLRNCTIEQPTGSTMLIVTGNTSELDGVTLLRGVSISGSNVALKVTNGMTLHAPITLSGTSPRIEFAGSQTLTGSGDIMLTTSGSTARGSTSGTWTIDNGVTISGVGTIGQAARPFVNRGKIKASTNAGVLTLLSNVWQNDNNGTLTAEGGGILSLGGTDWTNNGTINVNAATLRFSGTFDPQDIGVIQRTGGTIEITGTLTNTGSALALNAATGNFVLAGGTIDGCMVTGTGGARLDISSGTIRNGAPILCDVNILNVNALALTVQNGMSIGGIWSFLGSNQRIEFSGSQSLVGTGQIVLTSGAAVRPVGGTLTIAQGVTIRGTSGQVGEASQAVANNGTIIADVSGGTITVTGNGWSNQPTGQLLAQNGGTLNLTGSWLNFGAISESASTVNLGGTFSVVALGAVTRVGGNVFITGTLLNAFGSLSLDATTGVWSLNGGQIIGGVVNASAGGGLSVTGTGSMSGVTVNAPITVPGNSTLTVTGGMTLNGSMTLASTNSSQAATVNFSGSQTLAGFGQVVFGSGSSNQTLQPLNGSLIIGPGISIFAGAGTIGSASLGTTNHALVRAASSGQTLKIDGTNWSNAADGHIEAIAGGNLNLSGTGWTNLGAVSIQGGGTLTTAGTWTNVGTMAMTSSICSFGGTFAFGVSPTRSGGTIDITGTLQNSFSTFSLPAGSGVWNLKGGSILGGTITSGAGASIAVVSGGSTTATLNGVVMSAPVDIANGVALAVSNGLVLNNLLTLTSTGSTTTSLDFAGTQSLSGSGEVRFIGTGSAHRVRPTSGILTIASGMTIRAFAGGGTLGEPTLAFQNLGLIRAEAGTLTVTGTGWTNALGGLIEAVNGANLAPGSPSGAGFTNQGAMTVAAGGNISVPATTTGWSNVGQMTFNGTGLSRLDGTWTNTGTVTLNGASLTLAGNFALPGIIQRTGGSVTIAGQLINVFSTFTLPAGSGVWALANGGAVLGGTIAAGSGASLRLDASQSATLNGVVLAAPILVENAASLSITGGLTLNTTMTVMAAANTTAVTFSGTQSISGTGEIVFAGTTSNHQLQVPSGTLTIGPGVTIRGAGGQVGSSGSFVNQGMIRSEASGQSIVLTSAGSSPWSNAAGGLIECVSGGAISVGSGSTWTNNGTIACSGTGGLSLNGANWTNNGTINVGGTGSSTFQGIWTNGTGATINLNGATLTFSGTYFLSSTGALTRSGGIANLAGTCQNSFNTLVLPSSSGVWNLAGGTILGGTIAPATGTSLSCATTGTLNGVALALPLTIQNGGSVTVLNGLNLSSTITLASTSTSATANTTLKFSGNQSLTGTGDILFAAGGTANAVQPVSGTLTIGSQSTIHGGAGTVGAAGVGFVNNGTIQSEIANQTINLAGSNWSNSGTGTIRSINAGRLASQGTWTSAGTITVDQSGQWTSTGAFTQTSGTVTFAALTTLTSTGLVDLQGGIFIGSGTITGNVRNAADLRPGSSPGTLTMTGTYTQTASGTLRLEIGGPSLGNDLVAISGQAVLAGNLKLSLVVGFTPTLGQSFTLMTFAPLTTATGFTTVNGTAIGGSLALSVPTTLAVGSSNLTVSTIAAP